MTGNGLNPTYRNSDDWGMVYGIVLPTLFYLERHPAFQCSSRAAGDLRCGANSGGRSQVP